MIQVAIIDYGSGNLRSAAKAFERVAPEGMAVRVSDSPKALEAATHIVLPGVGAFADCMRGLAAAPGMRAALEREVLAGRKPFLGICVGMQMLFETGHEHGTHKGLGWLKGEVVKIGVRDQGAGCGKDAPRILDPDSHSLKVPHMGWNDLTLHAPGHPLLAGIDAGDHAYFVHSYHAVGEPSDLLATTGYGGPIAAVVARGNVMGTQFHPEKSQETGLKLIGNFLRMTGDQPPA